MRTCFAAALLVWANVSVAEESYRPTELAPETQVPACKLQSSDHGKLMTSLAFFISHRPVTRLYSIINGKLTRNGYPALSIEHPEAVLVAQPDCCSIAYDDHETFKAPRLRERLGSNFGGFVHIKIAEWGNSKDLANEVFYDVAGYVLDACGRPVFEMSK